MAVTVFPGEQYQAPRSWAEQAYPELIYYNEVDKGGHFAAWEQPQLFTGGGPRGVPFAAPLKEVVMSTTIETATEICCFNDR